MRRFSGSADCMDECATVSVCGRFGGFSGPEPDDKTVQNAQADTLATAIAGVMTRIDEMSRPPAPTLPRAVFSDRKLWGGQRCNAQLLP